jgi:hypothetical protein
MRIEITNPEIEKRIEERLETGRFKDAEEVILHALASSPNPGRVFSEAERAEAAQALMTFAKDHGITLGGMTLEELRREARP